MFYRHLFFPTSFYMNLECQRGWHVWGSTLWTHWSAPRQPGSCSCIRWLCLCVLLRHLDPQRIPPLSRMEVIRPEWTRFWEVTSLEPTSDYYANRVPKNGRHRSNQKSVPYGQS